MTCYQYTKLPIFRSLRTATTSGGPIPSSASNRTTWPTVVSHCPRHQKCLWGKVATQIVYRCVCIYMYTMWINGIPVHFIHLPWYWQRVLIFDTFRHTSVAIEKVESTYSLQSTRLSTRPTSDDASNLSKMDLPISPPPGLLNPTWYVVTSHNS